MEHSLYRRFAFPFSFALLAVGCTTGTNSPPDAGRPSPIVDGGFVCLYEEAVACIGNVHHSCERRPGGGEFDIDTVLVDCNEMTLEGRTTTCVPELGCTLCRPGEIFCMGDAVAECGDDGQSYEVREHCEVEDGFVCQQGRCRNLCDIAIAERSYVGCEFYAVDLDNAALGPGNDASAQQYSVVVSNPSGQPTEVVVERNIAPFGEPPVVEAIRSVTVLPGDLEVLDLPRREVDGSSSFARCSASAECDAGEACWCAGELRVEDAPPEGGHRDCRCRNAPGASGINDGTHSALTSNAYRLRSTLPIIAYQFNPLDNVGVFSNDASLLLPTSALGTHYSVVGWPQTIADSDDPNEDFDPRTDDEDLRAFLTIVGTAPGTRVTITFGPEVRRVIGTGGYPDAVPGDVWELTIGAFDVINLETAGFNADFTGTRVQASFPVAVFSGSEASDAPRFDTLANRQCCADHLEEQLFPDDTLGTRFYIGRMPPRTRALNAAFVDPTVDSVGEFNEPEYVRVLAVRPGITTIETTLPSPDNYVELGEGESLIFTATQHFEMKTSQPVAVLQVLPSQEAVGIPSYYPGGDPASIAVPPVQQYRREYVFLTPGLYAFDFVTITAPRTAPVLLDEKPISEFDCMVQPADGIRRRDGDPPPEWVVYNCQLSFPDVLGRNQPVQDGIQNDGYHTLRSTEPIGLVVYGFDAYVSYAYAGGLNLEPIN